MRRLLLQNTVRVSADNSYCGRHLSERIESCLSVWVRTVLSALQRHGGQCYQFCRASLELERTASLSAVWIAWPVGPPVASAAENETRDRRPTSSVLIIVSSPSHSVGYSTELRSLRHSISRMQICAAIAGSWPKRNSPSRIRSWSALSSCEGALSRLGLYLWNVGNFHIIYVRAMISMNDMRRVLARNHVTITRRLDLRCPFPVPVHIAISTVLFDDPFWAVRELT